jgi:hypothetical protein
MLLTAFYVLCIFSCLAIFFKFEFKELKTTTLLKYCLVFTLIEHLLVSTDYFLIARSGHSYWVLEFIELLVSELGKYMVGCAIIGIMWGFELDFNDIFGAGTYGENLQAVMAKKKA